MFVVKNMYMLFGVTYLTNTSAETINYLRYNPETDQHRLRFYSSVFEDEYEVVQCTLGLREQGEGT